MAEAENPCPCKQKLTDGQRGILNFGLNNNMLNDPNAAAVGVARQLAGRNGGRLQNIITSAIPGGQGGAQGGAGAALNAALPALNRLQNSLNRQMGIVDAFANESKRLSDPQNLLSTLSNLRLFGEMNCALGIEGIDIAFGLSVINQNGQFSIQGVVNANVDLERVLNQFSDGLGTSAADAVEKLQAGLNDAFSKIDAANNAIQNVVNQTQGMQQQAANFIQKYTSISALADLVNDADTDPCFKLGSVVNGNVVSPQFINAVRNGVQTDSGRSFR